MRKTKIKRIVTAVLASALMVSTAALFAGCGSTDTGTSGGGSTAESSLMRKAYFKWFYIYGNCLPSFG